MFPDEEGTETDTMRRPKIVRPSHTMFPDEEGTETRLRDEPARNIAERHTMFPDEEGTETQLRQVTIMSRSSVSHDVPRRGGD